MGITYRCKKCGHTNIEIQMGVNPNTNEIISDIKEGDNSCWCSICLKHTTFIVSDEEEKDE